MWNKELKTIIVEIFPMFIRSLILFPVFPDISHFPWLLWNSLTFPSLPSEWPVGHPAILQCCCGQYLVDFDEDAGLALKKAIVIRLAAVAAKLSLEVKLTNFSVLWVLRRTVLARTLDCAGLVTICCKTTQCYSRLKESNSFSREPISELSYESAQC